MVGLGWYPVRKSMLTEKTAVAPHLGITAMIALVAADQITCSLNLDRFG